MSTRGLGLMLGCGSGVEGLFVGEMVDECFLALEDTTDILCSSVSTSVGCCRENIRVRRIAGDRGGDRN